MQTKRQLFDHEARFNSPLWESRKIMKTDSHLSVFNVDYQDQHVSNPPLGNGDKSIIKCNSFLSDPYVNMVLNAKPNTNNIKKPLNTRSKLLEINQNYSRVGEEDFQIESIHFEPKITEKSTLNESHFNFKAIQTTKQIPQVKTKEQYVNQNLPTKEHNTSESIRVFTGTIERVIKWNKIYKDFCHYEVYGPVISLQEGSVHMEKILLLKNNKGPVLQVVYYMNDYISIENFYIGQILKCVGRMISPNMFRAVSIRGSDPDEVRILQRMCYVNDHAISKAIIKQ